MSRHRIIGRRASALAIAALAALAAGACGPKEPPVTSEALARIEAARREAQEEAAAYVGRTNRSESPPESPSEAPPQRADRAPSAGTEQVTLEPDGGLERPRTLAEAAAEARRQRQESGPSKVVIDNENLAEYAAAGQVTVASPGKPGPDGTAAGENTAAQRAAAPGDPPFDPEAPPGGPRDERYWRDGARDIRTRWAAATDEVALLEGEAAELRWAFYEADDPYDRDRRIKPEWDRVLDELRRARQDARAYRRELQDFVEEGRSQGALPGWLREGIELEPEPPEEPEQGEPSTGRQGEPEEPSIYDGTREPVG